MRSSLAVALYAASQLLLLASLWIGMRRCSPRPALSHRENPTPPPASRPPVSQTRPLGPRARVDQASLPGAPLAFAGGIVAWFRRRPR